MVGILISIGLLSTFVLHNNKKGFGKAFFPPRSINNNICYLFKRGNQYVDLSVLYFYYAYHLSDICIAG